MQHGVQNSLPIETLLHSKHIQVLGVEDKRQVTIVVSSTANGNLPPGQVAFTSTTHRCLLLQMREN
jgi:hypothetical protein